MNLRELKAIKDGLTNALHIWPNRGQILEIIELAQKQLMHEGKKNVTHLSVGYTADFKDLGGGVFISKHGESLTLRNIISSSSRQVVDKIAPVGYIVERQQIDKHDHPGDYLIGRTRWSACDGSLIDFNVASEKLRGVYPGSTLPMCPGFMIRIK